MSRQNADDIKKRIDATYQTIIDLEKSIVNMEAEMRAERRKP